MGLTVSAARHHERGAARSVVHVYSVHTLIGITAATSLVRWGFVCDQASILSMKCCYQKNNIRRHSDGSSCLYLVTSATFGLQPVNYFMHVLKAGWIGE